MEIYTNNTINFNANYINKANILKRNIFGKYQTKKASFIEFDVINNMSDLRAIEAVSNKWKTENIGSGNHFYVNKIYETALGNMPVDPSMVRFLAITNQKRNFEKINPDKILCIALIRDNIPDQAPLIELLQTRPKYSHSDKNIIRKIKHIGFAMLENVKTLSNKQFKLYSVEKSKEFYKKFGATEEKYITNSIYADNGCYYI